MRNKKKEIYRRTSIIVEDERLKEFDRKISTLGIKRTTAINILIEWFLQTGRLPELKTNMLPLSGKLDRT